MSQGYICKECFKRPKNRLVRYVREFLAFLFLATAMLLAVPTVIAWMARNKLKVVQ